MRILLSAYACEPGRGSESAVGWHWALEIARRGHQVEVLTRSNNSAAIEAALAKMHDPPPLRFLYYDLPSWLLKWKGSGPSVYPYYIAWQHGAWRLAPRRHAEQSFDLVHHITFAGMRLPSFLWRLGVPFIFGPAGGGEGAPWRLIAGLGVRGLLAEAARSLANAWLRFDPLLRLMYSRASRVFSTSPQSLALLPRQCRDKTSLALAVGSDGGSGGHAGAGLDDPARDRFRVLFAGNFFALKGMHLGLPAFALLAADMPEARLTMVGKGPASARWRALAARLGIAHRVDWLPWQSRADLQALYAAHDVLLFPSLRDSGGMVVIEALQEGVPVICLDIGGPGIMVDSDCGYVVPTAGRCRADVVSDLADGLLSMAKDLSLRDCRSHGARRRAATLSWERQVAAVYEQIDRDCRCSGGDSP